MKQQRCAIFRSRKAFKATTLREFVGTDVAPMTFEVSVGYSVSATRDEHALPMPGDDLIRAPVGSLTNAVTIGRPPSEVWPWLVQMGAGRAGWYSYDFLDNGRQPSARQILAPLQKLEAGGVMPALPGRTDGFTVVHMEVERDLVIGWRLPDGSLLMTWTFLLLPSAGGGTRLVVRARGAAGYRLWGLPAWVSTLLVRPIHFIMERKQLLGIKGRVETRLKFAEEVV